MAGESVPFIEQHLMPGERLLASGGIHSVVVIIPALALLAAVILGLIGLDRGQQGFPLIIGSAVLGVVLTLVVIARMIRRATTEFGLTDKRLVIKSGWVTTNVEEMPLGKVEAIRVEQGIVGKLFGFGSLVAVGSGGTQRTYENIADPFGFYKRVQQQVALAQKTP